MSKITDISQLDLNKQYTYADFLTWVFDHCVELIKGWIYKIGASKNRKHHHVSGNITMILGDFVSKKNYHLYKAPFDVRLKKTKEAIVQWIQLSNLTFLFFVKYKPFAH